MIRVATKQTQSIDSIERVLTLETRDGALVPLGALEANGAAGTAFLGDRGYLPTSSEEYSVVDLTEPSHPSLGGQIEIPGFSGYLSALDGTHLLALGRDETPYRQLQDAALMIFDLSDPYNPSRPYRYLFTDPLAAATSIDQRGIKFDSTGGIFAFPYKKEVSGESTLEVLSASVEDGFAHLGTIGEAIDWDTCLASQGLSASDIADIESNPNFQLVYASSCPSPEVFTRSLFRDGFVYGISDENVYAYALDSMAAGPVQQVRLPAPAGN